MTDATKHIAVVGQGVIGLTSAVRLLARGYTVDVFSREPFEATTSMVAGAYWWPHKAYPKERVAAWAKATYDVYDEARQHPGAGVHFEDHYRFCLDPDDSAYVRHMADEWEAIDGSDFGIECYEAFRVVVPVIDVPVFMAHLKARVEAAGATFHLRELEAPAELFPDYDLVVNCTGVWARHFVGDASVYPIRGQSVRMSRPKGLVASHRLYKKEDTFTLVLPRSSDVILGGTAHEDNWDRTPDPEDTEAIRRQCTELVPELADAEVLGAAVGLRPGRDAVRLELERLAPGQPVIHNYGHGGSGYTVCWGCAAEVAQLADDYFAS